MSDKQPLHAPTDRVMEITLEVSDLERAAHFYRDIVGMPEVERWQERPAIWLKAATGTYLGLWKPESGGPGVGLHGSQGGMHIHLAFLVPHGTLDELETRLRDAGISIDGDDKLTPERRSLYMHDPDGNVIEFADWTRSWEGLPVEH